MPKKKIVLKLLAVAALLALLVANSHSIISPIRTRLADLLSIPLKSIHNLCKLSGRIVPFSSLRDENKVLRARIDLLNRQMEESKMLAAENQRLKDIIGFKNAAIYSTIPAEVIGRDPSNWSNSLIINKGALQGIRQNKAVISMRGLVGRVLELGRNSSKILLISDPNSRVSAVIQRNRQGGMLVGRPDGKCKMIYIALDSDVAKGDKVITAGFGSVFPRGILVGEVEDTGKEPGRLYKYAIVKPAQDMTKLEDVMCIK